MYNFQIFIRKSNRLIEASRFYNVLHLRSKQQGYCQLNLGDTQQRSSYWWIHEQIKLNGSKGVKFK